MIASLPTVGIPESEQFGLWREAISSAFVPLDAQTSVPIAFGGTLVSQIAGAVHLCEVGGAAVEVTRSPSAIRRDDPGYLKLGLQLSGSGSLTQDHREASLAPGDFAIYDTRRPYQLRFDERFRMLVVMFPRERFGLGPSELGEITACRVAGHQGLGGLVAPFLTNLAAQLRTEDVLPTHALSDAVLDLLAVALSQKFDRQSAISPETQRHALILRIESFIEGRLGDPELKTATLASAYNVSPRYVQKLFESEGCTVTEWIRTRRLEHCRAELLDPQHAGIPIGVIAARWGLLDFSYFSHLFRSKYGLSPREYRSANAVMTPVA